MPSQTSDDLNRHLLDAMDALHLSSKSYDEGFVGEAKRLSATIRVLVHDTTKSYSLLNQLAIKDKLRYYATPGGYSPTNLLSECHLVLIWSNTQKIQYKPVLDDFPPIGPWGRLKFEGWWNQRVVRDGQGREMSRKDIVLSLANKDGGAHVDVKLNQVYADLSRNNSLGWFCGSSDVVIAPEDGPHFACARQIAHELEKTIRENLDPSVSATG